jgi:predicted nucleotidyltransferase
MLNQLPTPYPDLNAALARFLAEVQTVLGERFVGLYLHGSLAYGDFNPQTSDIDFLVVTADDLPGKMLALLKTMHARLRTSGLTWATRLEGAYIQRQALRRYDPANAQHPWLGVDGHFAIEQLSSEWIIQRWILREKGIAVAGPPLKSMIDPVSPDDLRQAVRGSLREWWSPPFPSPERFQSGEYQAYAILTMCRSLYVLEHGRVASKPESARWVMKTLGQPWVALIEQALACQPGMPFSKYNETLGFIQYTLERNKQRTEPP